MNERKIINYLINKFKNKWTHYCQYPPYIIRVLEECNGSVLLGIVGTVNLDLIRQSSAAYNTHRNINNVKNNQENYPHRDWKKLLTGLSSFYSSTSSLQAIPDWQACAWWWIQRAVNIKNNRTTPYIFLWSFFSLPFIEIHGITSIVKNEKY